MKRKMTLAKFIKKVAEAEIKRLNGGPRCFGLLHQPQRPDKSFVTTTSVGKMYRLK